LTNYFKICPMFVRIHFNPFRCVEHSVA
jgi:hypothetical protein